MIPKLNSLKQQFYFAYNFVDQIFGKVSNGNSMLGITHFVVAYWLTLQSYKGCIGLDIQDGTHTMVDANCHGDHSGTADLNTYT